MLLDVVIMAAGKGTRMKSAHPKVLHTLAGRPLLQHVLEMSAGLSAERLITITGHGADRVESDMRVALPKAPLVFVRQEPQLGTGHAVQQAVPELADDGTTLILNGDVPLIRAETARALIEACGGEQLVLLTVALDDPTGYGRIVREGDQVRAIVEHKDATPEQRAIREGYTGMMAAPTAHLKRWLANLNNDNAQKEYYLTDIVAMAVADGVPVVATLASSETEVLGVNSPLQLAQLERRFQAQQAEILLEAGVRMADPARFDLRGVLECGRDVSIDVNCVFEGCVTLGDDVRIGANCVIRNATIAAGAVIHPFTHIDGETLGVEIGEGALIGPFARLRPGAKLAAEVHIGNFVEVKNSTMARGAKANHLAYLGDAVVGERVNYGAGSITANYDGANKHRTTIEADVHIGSQLCADRASGHRCRFDRGRRLHHQQGRASGAACGGAWSSGQPGRLDPASQGVQSIEGEQGVTWLATPLGRRSGSTEVEPRRQRPCPWSPTHYQRLGLDEDCSLQDVDVAWHRIALSQPPPMTPRERCEARLSGQRTERMRGGRPAAGLRRAVGPGAARGLQRLAGREREAQRSWFRRLVGR